MKREKPTVTYPIGEICDRCGMDKSEVRRTQFGCNTWGRTYPTHMWNKEPRTVEIAFVERPK